MKVKEIIYICLFEVFLVKEEVFRNILILFILLKNLFGDLVVYVKEDVVDGFCDIFVFNRYCFLFCLNGNFVYCSFIFFVKNCMYVLFFFCGGI